MGLVVAAVAASGLVVATGSQAQARPASAADVAAASTPTPARTGPMAKDASTAGRTTSQGSLTAPLPVRLATAASASVTVPAAGYARVGTSVVSVGAAASAAGAPATARATLLGGAVRSVGVRVFNSADARKLAGTSSLLAAQVTPATGSSGAVSVRFDADGVRHAFGGGYASRLRLFTVPACHTRTPAAPACQLVPLDTANDVSAGTLTAAVPVGRAGTTVAALATPTGGTGNYTATPLTASGAWEVGIGSGAFTWSYPISAPAPPGGATPSVALGYDSQAVDGQTTDENGQSSWLGSGWNLSTGFVERKYRACADEPDATSKGMKGWGDLCWSSANSYVITLNGHTSDLINANSAGTEFRLKDDPGWRVHKYSGRQGNDDAFGEYFVVTTPDGTDYSFGDGSTPWSASVPTQSVFLAPVYGDDAGEPCHASTLAASSCQIAWRWNLDRVIDRSGNAATYLYEREKNAYGSRDGSTKMVYDRGGYPTEIQYGGSINGTSAQNLPTSKITFTVVNRCTADLDWTPGTTPSCPALASRNASSYPDTPVDLLCTIEAGTGDCDSTTQRSPTFFTAVRLAEILTWSNNGTAWRKVDSFRLTHAFPTSGLATGQDPELWLSQIKRVGIEGYKTDYTGLELNPVTFGGDRLQNPVNLISSSEPAYKKLRVTSIVNELGGRTDVAYGHASSDATCSAGSVGSYVPWTNTRECFRAKYRVKLSDDPEWGWFHKYVTNKVTVTSPAYGQVLTTDANAIVQSEPQVTVYRYLGSAAWHHDDSQVQEKNKLTWSDWRGYGQVDVLRKGVSNGGYKDSVDRVQTRYTVFRGMNGDPSNEALTTTRTVYVSTVDGDVLDNAYLQGRVAQASVYDSSGTELHRSRTKYWSNRIVNGQDTVGVAIRDSWSVKPLVEVEETRDVHSNGNVGWAGTRTTSTYTTTPSALLSIDNGLLATQTVEPVSTGGPEQVTCTATRWKTTGAASGWVAKVASTHVFEDHCPNPADSTDKPPVVSWVDNYYDGASPGNDADLGHGLLKWVRTYTSASHYIDTRTGYAGPYDRVVSSTDGLGRTTTTSYYPDTGRPTSTTVTSPAPNSSTAGFTTTTAIDPVRGLPTRITDANGKVTTLEYDKLGRLHNVVKPGQQGTSLPSLQFDYSTVQGNTNRVRASTLQSMTGSGSTATGTYSDVYTYVDGLGRTVQTQVDAPGAAAVLTVTRYDEIGRQEAVSGPVSFPTANKAPAGFQNLDPTSFGLDTVTAYDAIDRVTATITRSKGAEKWRTSTVWDGSQVSVTPPTGGNVVSTLDNYGRTTQILEYNDNANGVPYAVTKLGYDAANRLAKVTSPKGAVSTYAYDRLGRRTQSVDPDTGTSTSVYDDANNVTSTTDARNVTITTAYDNLDRPTTVSKGTTTLSSYSYDSKTNGKGRLASATSYATAPGASSASAYTTSVAGYDDDGRPTGSSWSIPAGFGVPSAVSYSESYTYDAAGHVLTAAYPALGNVPAESVTAVWNNSFGTPSKLSTSQGGTIVASTGYDTALGRLTGRRWGSATGPLRTYSYDDMGRVTDIDASATLASGNAGQVQQDHLYYTGPVLSRIHDELSGQRECFGYDDQRRLTHAWTTKVDCTDAATTPADRGADPYDQAWAFDTDNTFTSYTNKLTGAVTTYTAGGTGKPAHAVTGISTTAGSTTSSSTLGYDASGYQTSRAVTAGSGSAGTLTWDDLHRLSSTTGDVAGTTAAEAGTQGAGTTRYVYAVDGSRLLRQTPTGTTLTLGASEITYPSSGTATARRYYTLGGSTVAVRNGTSLSWLASNTQGSTELSIDGATGRATRTRYTPYGAVRGTSPGVFGTGLPTTDKGWLGKTLDASDGLTHLGARYYDADTAFFNAPDPLFDPKNPRTINPYTYTGGNPIAFMDPTGLCYQQSDGTYVGVNCGGGDKPEIPSGTKGKSGRRKQTPSGGTPAPPAPVVDRPQQASSPQADNRSQEERTADLFAKYYGVTRAGSYNPSYTSTDPNDAHPILEACGFVLDVCDAIDGLISAWQGDYAGAALSATSLIPLVGIAPGAAKLARTASRLCSFTGSTLVLMDDGSHKPIEEVTVGDKVVATDPETGEQSSRVVEQIFVHEDMVIDLVAGGEVITTTENHPFWSVSKRRFVQAESLERGERILGADGRPVVVSGLRPATRRKALAFNLAVEGIHTYHVGVVGALVHNTCSEAQVQSALQDAFPTRDVRGGAVVRREDGSPITDFDVYDDDFICEVACGGGTGKVSQMQNRILPNSGGRRVAVYGPNMKGSVVKGIEGLGVPVFRTLDELIGWVGPKL